LFICCDLEGTCWNSGPMRDRQRRETEIIEIGAVRLDAHCRVIDEFQTFVQPVRHATLSDFCVELTSITQAEVEAAPLLAPAMEAFRHWIGDPESALVSWGDFDRNQIRKDCRRSAVPHPLDLGLHINAKDEYALWAKGHGLGRKGRGMRRALDELDMPFDGQQHRGIDDARNLAKVFAHIRSPENMSIEARFVYKLVLSRGAVGTHVGHTRAALAADLEQAGPSALPPASPKPRLWWKRVQAELIRIGLVHDLMDGRGLAPLER
jgi:3'-5' exoribonuclease 1